MVKVEVEDLSKTVASQLQLVGDETRSDIPQVERLFAVERRSGVAVRDGHVGDGESVKRLSSVVPHIVENETFSVVEADVQGPFLPLDLPPFQRELPSQNHLAVSHLH